MESQPTTSKHSRQGSSGRVLPIRSARGALDISKSPIYPPPSSPIFSPQAESTLLPPTSSSQRAHLPPSPGFSHLSNLAYRAARSPLTPSRTFSAILDTPKDFSALLNPSLYHNLTVLDTPAPFRNASSKLDPLIPLSELIALGQFRRAAAKAAEILTTLGQNLILEQIFDLFYQRLACLTLCNQTALAAQEVKALEDLGSSFYYDEQTGNHRVPWELRVLAVRLQGIGFSDVRKGVVGYYDLVSEVRTTLTSLKKQRNLMEGQDSKAEGHEKEIRMWENRLGDLGIRIANALIEMEDFEGATRFLATLNASSNNSQLRNHQALLWLSLGDIETARSCAGEEKVTIALAYMAEADFEKAAQCWENLIATGDSQDIAIWKHNLSVSLIYLGRVDEAREILESLVSEGHAFHALTFNLSTIYELCSERSRFMKVGLAEKVSQLIDERRANKGDGPLMVGWEKVNGDFKL
ncbi:hypothetical protein K3495_g6894 [Podosphaera aphanis]|nr:hypothetical protein K3495_g6894 [Podosphaera aphanis]